MIISMVAIGIDLAGGAAQQLIQPDPPQHTFHQACMVGLMLCGIVGGRVNLGVMRLFVADL